MQKFSLSDRQLIEAFNNGSEQALNDLMERHKDRIFTTIFLMVKNRPLAEDLFQDTVIKIITNLKANRYAHEGKFLPWACRIARNVIIDHYRLASRMKYSAEGTDHLENSLSTAEDASPVQELMESETNATLRKLVQQLPMDQREVLILRHYSNMSFKEIAQVTEVSVNTALGRMRYALLNLKKLITKNHITL